VDFSVDKTNGIRSHFGKGKLRCWNPGETKKVNNPCINQICYHHHRQQPSTARKKILVKHYQWLYYTMYKP